MELTNERTAGDMARSESLLVQLRLSPAGAQRSDIPPRKEQHSDIQREECLELDLVNEVTTSPSARPLTN